MARLCPQRGLLFEYRHIEVFEQHSNTSYRVDALGGKYYFILPERLAEDEHSVKLRLQQLAVIYLERAELLFYVGRKRHFVLL